MSSLDAGGTGRRLGRYHLAEPLGGGPTGEVFRAKVYGVAGFERQFAVKRLHNQLVSNPEVAAQLATSTRMYGSLEHPRIARLHEYGVAGGDTFTAVELIEGIDLSRLLSTSWGMGEPLLAGAAASLVSQLARAIGYAHGRGITHLGVCPTNLIATPSGDVKVTDFGLLPPRLPAKPGNDPTLAARIGYLAPEQLVGEETSAATDVFQIGAVAYELFTGNRCFRGRGSFEIAQAILSSQVANPTLPKPLVKVLMRCLARSPFERFPDAGALADALDAAVRSTPLPGAKRDIAAAVASSLAKINEMNQGQASGALSFPLPAPPPVAGPGSVPAAPASQGLPLSKGGGELTGEIPTIPRHTMMGVGLGDKPFKVPDIIPQARHTGDDDNAPTTIRGHQQGMLQPRTTLAGVARAPGSPPIAPPRSPTPPPGLPAAPPLSAPASPPPVARPASDVSMPAIELSMSDLQIPGDSQVADLAELGSPSGLDASAPHQRHASSPGLIGSLDDPTPLPAPMPHDAMPDALPLTAEPSGSTLLPFNDGQSAPTQGGGGGAIRIVLALIAVAVLGVGGFFGYRHFAGGEVKEVAQAKPVAPNGPVVENPATKDEPPAATFDAGATAVAVTPLDAAAAALAVTPPDATAALAVTPPDAAAAVAVAPTPPDAGSAVVEPVVPDVSGKLAIESTPKGAKVYLDGTYKGKTPVSLDGVPDQVSLAVVRAGFKLHTASITGSGTHRVKLVAVTPPDGPAGIKVRCKKKNRYYVFVDGHDVGQLCPTERLGVEKGEHEVVIYDPETEQRRTFRVKVTQTRNSHRLYIDNAK